MLSGPPSRRTRRSERRLYRAALGCLFGTALSGCPAGEIGVGGIGPQPLPDGGSAARDATAAEAPDALTRPDASNDAPADAAPDAGRSDSSSPADVGADDAGSPGWIDPTGGEDVLEATRVLETRDNTDLPVWFDGALRIRLDGESVILRDGAPTPAFEAGTPRRQCGAVDRDGSGAPRLYCIEIDEELRRVVRIRTDGTEEVLVEVDASTIPGLGNDHTAGAHVYYSNRCDGAPTCSGAPDGVLGSVYHLTPDGRLESYDLGLPNPNGVQLVPSGDQLLVAASAYKDRSQAGLYRVDVAADGALSNPQQITSVPTPDGLTIDRHGNAYVASNNSSVRIYRLDDGTELGRIRAAGRVTNVGFGGDDGGTLYLTTSNRGVYAIELPVSGVIP